ncbi:MAG: S8 family serine peptidase [Acidobacteria bacterium]|nr:S8 family serine peptidase [Acidobacteriota bacterium]
MGNRATRIGSTALVSVLALWLAALPARAAPAAGDVPAVGLDVASRVPGQWIVSLAPELDPSTEAPKLASAYGGEAGLIYTHVIGGFSFSGSDAAAVALAEDARVVSVVPDRRVSALAETLPTGVSRIRAHHSSAPNAHASGYLGAGVRIAIVDTGIDSTHPDLTVDAASGTNCISPGSPPDDDHGHGTHVSGTAAAVAGNGLGVIGVAPQATVVPVKVLDANGSGTWSQVICGVDWVTGLDTDADPANDVQVANMSLGGSGNAGSCTDGGFRQAICQSVAAGVVYAVAAGNNSSNASGTVPAAFPEAITTSALIDRDGEPGGQGGCEFQWGGWGFRCDDTFADFSNYGAGIDVIAPGVDIHSTYPGGYNTMSGTSMASPHVAGVAALARAANPSLTPAQVESLLRDTGDCPDGTANSGGGDCGGQGTWTNDGDSTPEPLVNALRAAEAAGGGGGPGDSPPTVTTTNPAGGSTVSGTVTVQVNATDDHDAAGSLSTAVSIDGGAYQTATYNATTARYERSWDTSGLANGSSHTIDARATDSAGNVGSAARVTVTVDNAQPGPRATVTTYTGPTSGRVFESVTLSARLTDQATGQPVAGKQVGFTLGSASATATTDANGVAAAQVTLWDYPGQYTVKARFGGDAGNAASEASRPFEIKWWW